MLGVDAATIPLESTVVVVCVVAVAMLAVVVLAGGWNRWSHPGPARAVSLLVAVAAVVATGGVLVNRAGGFYPTLGSLSATPPGGVVPVARVPVRTGRGRLTTLHPGHGLGDVEAYLPAAYSDPTLAQALFPTVVWTGGPLSASPLPDRLDAAVDGDRMPPVVVLAAPGGRVRGLRAVAGSLLRLRPDREAWAVVGPVSDGRCPVDVALRAPSDYAAATGRACRELPHDPRPSQILATALADRPDDVGAARRIGGASTPSAPVGTEIVPAGTGAGAVLDDQLQWLGSHLAGPVVTGEGGGRREPA
ncbi:hypothetical protein EV383_5024 [Pseudonocardia sediminis]|uniref:Esterase n=1 Tax=Pseudonocardia sediminis TaxID=1397368 RepID=A0A4Q7V5Y1_PSEST|nr:hypothetical protein [Pseudonocardia sediminis]RZT88089.1 hypothetical protein EV383_5024 [Pseudonocardia sediminis]